jgi:predicted HAD superfamily hydrolase
VKIIEGTTGINSVNAGSVNVYPTFVTENVSVSSSENVNVQIIDLSGKVVFQSVEAQQLQTIDANNLVNGVYMVKVYNNNIAEMQKIVVQK